MPRINTLFCLPFAGGNSYSYRPLITYLTDFVRVVPIELPGRGQRLDEPLVADLEKMAAEVLTKIPTELLQQPYAFYGHSMGAWLSYLITVRIYQAHLPMPQHLLVSGRRAPSIEVTTPPKHRLPKPDFFKTLKELGGCPPAVLANDELMDFFEPILRNDFEAIETYQYQPVPPLNVPITVLLGRKDNVNYAQAMAWQRETTYPLTIHWFTGGHFFIFDHLPALKRLFSQILAG